MDYTIESIEPEPTFGPSYIVVRLKEVSERPVFNAEDYANAEAFKTALKERLIEIEAARSASPPPVEKTPISVTRLKPLVGQKLAATEIR